MELDGSRGVGVRAQENTAAGNLRSVSRNAQRHLTSTEVVDFFWAQTDILVALEDRQTEDYIRTSRHPAECGRTVDQSLLEQRGLRRMAASENRME